MAEIPKKEVIDEIYKDKINQNNQISGEMKPKNNTEENDEDKKRENDNNLDKSEQNNSSKLNESHMKRRQGMYNIYPINKKDEQNKDDKKDLNKEVDDKDKEQNDLPKMNPILQKVLDFESSQIGIIVIIIITIIGLLFYDVKNALIPGKFDLICMAIIFVLTLYHIFDLIFRNIYLEKSVGTLHFKLQFLSVISLIFDFNLALFLLIRFVLFKTNNKDNKYLSSYNSKLLMYIFNFVQVFKYLRFLKIYFMINKLLKELEKKRKFNEVLNELKKKGSKSKALNGPISGRLSKVKANMNNATTAMIKNLNNMMIGKNENGNVSNLTNNSITNKNDNKNDNKNENNKANNNNNLNTNTNTNNNINITNNMSELVTGNPNKTDLVKENTSIIPLNINVGSPTNKNKGKQFLFKNELGIDKDKENKIMEKINDKFEQTRIATRLNNGICQFLIINIIMFFGVYTLTKGSFIYKKENEYEAIHNYLNSLGRFCKKNYENNCSEILSNKITSFLSEISIQNYYIIQIEFMNDIIYRNESLSNNTQDYYSGEYIYLYSKNDPSTTIMVLKQYYFKMDALINILKLIFIFVSVYIICLRLNNDINLLILKPLNDINKVIDKVSKDPVNNKILSELRHNFENRIGNVKNDKNNVKYEMKVVESALIRISGLIAVGYGEAGSAIIKQFIKGNEGFDPMSSGNIIEAIFGFCFIHDFGKINEVFEEKTMNFVNDICDIVHSCVDKFNGYTNKNIGDCFLLAWKIKNSENKPARPNSSKNIFIQNQNEELTELADCALLAFLNVFKKINKSKRILAYRKDPDIIKRFGTRYSIALGFGLHYGWGIEGAIGSHHKIDCSYLSPNVNIAARLETATNIYGVDILFSGEFYELLSDYMKEKCRKIDVVTLKGSEKPVNLYTVDLNKNIKPGKSMSKKDRMSLREKMDYYSQKKKKLWKKYESSKKVKTIGEIYYKQSKGFRQILMNQKSSLFYNNFEEGLSHYIDGEWDEASSYLFRALYLENNDGPTKTILEYMRKLNFKAPDDWDGYRVLTSKT